MTTHNEDVIEACNEAEVNLIEHRNHCRRLADMPPLTQDEIVAILLERREEQRRMRESESKYIEIGVSILLVYVLIAIAVIWHGTHKL